MEEDRLLLSPEKADKKEQEEMVLLLGMVLLTGHWPVGRGGNVQGIIRAQTSPAFGRNRTKAILEPPLFLHSTYGLGTLPTSAIPSP